MFELGGKVLVNKKNFHGLSLSVRRGTIAFVLADVQSASQLSPASEMLWCISLADMRRNNGSQIAFGSSVNDPYYLRYVA